MEQVRSNDWMRHISKLLRAGAIISLIAVFLPSAGVIESFYGYHVTFFFWYTGFFWASLTGYAPETGFIGELYSGTNYVAYGVGAIVLLIIAFILLNVGASKSSDQRDMKIAAGTSAVGGILSFIGPAVYYFGVKQDIPGFFGIGGFDPSFAVYLPIIGGILGIIGAIMAGYAYSLEIKGEPIRKTSFQPTTDKMTIDKEPEVTNQQEKPVFCKNCGTKLKGEYCQECGQKAEFLIH